MAIGKGLGKSGHAGKRTETQSKTHLQSQHNGEPPRLRDGRYVQEFSCYDILHFPLEILSHPAIGQMIVRAESDKSDCLLCGASLKGGRLAVVGIGPERDGQVLAMGCCEKCLCSLGTEAAGRAMAQILVDDCYGGGAPLDVHVGSEEVH